MNETTHKAKPSEMLERISDLFITEDIYITRMTFVAAGKIDPWQAYGFWITPKSTFNFADHHRHALAGLFYSNGYKTLSFSVRGKDIVIFGI